MHSRRSFLGTLAAGTAASMAGCGILDSGGSSSLLGERWFTEAVAKIGPESHEETYISEAEARAPARAAQAEGLSDSLSQDVFERWDVSEDVPLEDVDRVVWGNQPAFGVNVGDFSAADARAAVSEEATEMETDLDATVHVRELSHDRGYVASATADGVAIQLWQRPDRDRLEDELATLLAATNGNGGSSLFSSDPTSKLSDHLEDGIYSNYGRLGLDRPYGLSVALDGSTARRRIVWVAQDAEAAKESSLLDEGLRSAVKDRAYHTFDDREFEPFDSVDAQRNGRVVETEATLPVERLHFYDIRYPFYAPLDW